MIALRHSWRCIPRLSASQWSIGSRFLEVGEHVSRDELVANIETDKITLPVNCPEDGVIVEVFAQPGDTVTVGSDLFKLDVGAVEASVKSKSEPAKAEAPKAEVPVKEAPKVESKPENKPEPIPESKPAFKAPEPKAEAKPLRVEPVSAFGRSEARVRMTPMRSKIAQRLKESQEIAASLTTFNEVDMSALMEMRKQYQETIQKKHGVKMGFMGAFVKAASTALLESPLINSRIEGQEIVTPNFVDISVAVSTGKGLVTPVIRNCHSMDIISVEKMLSELSDKARNNKLAMEDLSGGTFTISNGGVFGSLMGTPIINLPQSAILGMHAIKERPIVVNGSIQIRPMMYLALTYDHRIIDGKEAVTFLVRIKELLEDPRRYVLGL